MNPDSPSRFACRFPNQLAALSGATEQAMAFLDQHGIGGQAAYAINLAIEEMATNILKYGYDDAAEHQIELRAEVRPHQVALVLEDDGHEFNPLLATPPDLSLGLDEREPGGLGICLVRKFSESVTYERQAGKNRLAIVVAY